MRSVARNVTGSDSIRAEQTATCGTITVLPADDNGDGPDNGDDPGNGDDPDPTEPRELPLGLLAADLTATRAITVAAPPEHVWPWLAQLGQARGGFYSYDRLENLVGCDIHSATELNPAWQDIGVGDPVHLHPEVELEVAAVDPGRALVLRGAVPIAGSAASGAAAAGGHSTRGTPGGGAAEAPYDFSWAFVLGPCPEGSRLVVRERYGYLRRRAALLVEPLSVVSCVMTQRMLRGIRERAEATSGVPDPGR